MIRRRWLQFSLRSFLIVVTVGCLWLGWNVERATRRGREVVCQAGRHKSLMQNAKRKTQNRFRTVVATSIHPQRCA